MTIPRDPEKEAFWRMVLQEHKKSDLSIRQFCRDEGLSESLFYAWRRELKFRDQEPKPETEPTLSSNSIIGDSPSHLPQLVPVKIVDAHNHRNGIEPQDSGVQNDSPVIIQSSGGFQVEVPLPLASRHLFWLCKRSVKRRLE